MKLTWKALAEKEARVLPLQRMLRSAPHTEEDRVLAYSELRALCPAVQEVMDALGSGMGDRRFYARAFDRCGFSKDGVVTAADRSRWGGLSLWVSLLYRTLRKRGVAARLARVLSRAWLREHAGLAPWLGKTKLVPGSSLRRLGDEPIVKVGRPMPKPGKHPVVLLADRKTRFAEVRAAVQRAAKAGHAQVMLLVRGADDMPALVPVQTRAPKADRPGLDLTVVMKPPGIYVRSRFGTECGTGQPVEANVCFAASGGVYSRALLRKLRLHLWYLFGEKYRDPSSLASEKHRHVLHVEGKGAVTLAQLVAVMEEVRTIPAKAKSPPVPERVPRFGCRKDYDRDKRRWRFPSGPMDYVERACMYHRVVLR